MVSLAVMFGVPNVTVIVGRAVMSAPFVASVIDAQPAVVTSLRHFTSFPNEPLRETVQVSVPLELSALMKSRMPETALIAALRDAATAVSLVSIEYCPLAAVAVPATAVKTNTRPSGNEQMSL